MNKLRFLIASLVLMICYSCAENRVDQKDEAEKLMELSRAWSQSVKGRNLEEMISYWSDDAILMSPNEAAVVGKDSLRAMVQRSLQIPGFDIG